MKLIFKKNELSPDRCFSARQDTIPCIEHDWHFHPELELIYFLKSTGTRFVGNSIGNFEPGELYLIGSNVPHLFRNDRAYYEQNEGYTAVNLVVIKFLEDFLGSGFAELAESQTLRRFLQKAKRGIKISKSAIYLAHSHILGLLGSNGLSGVAELLKILDILSTTDNHELLCDEEIENSFSSDEKERMGRVISFLNENFEKNIKLAEVSSIACMTPNAFCRYFKTKTKKSFTQFLIEIRLGNACKMLIEGNEQIATVAYRSGFNTVTNFNRQFKSLMNLTPSEYMEKYRELEKID